MTPPPQSTMTASVRRYERIADGLAHPPREPFVVSRADAVEFAGLAAPDRILDVLLSCRTQVFGYDRSGKPVYSRSDEVVRRLREGTLDLNVVDVDVPSLHRHLPLDTLRMLNGGMVSPVLTPAGAYTALHFDPPGAGAGWMYLAGGRKRWVLVDPACRDLLLDPDANDGRLLDVPIGALRERAPAGAIRQVTIAAGDFLFFPPYWMHRVTTDETSIGLGGYCKVDTDT